MPVLVYNPCYLLGIYIYYIYIYIHFNLFICVLWHFSISDRKSAAPEHKADSQYNEDKRVI